MIITILGSLIGLVTSALPNLIKIWKAKIDAKHELDILKVQLEHAKILHEFQLQEIEAEADIQEMAALHKRTEVQKVGIKVIDGFLTLINGLVRPTITYAFFAFYGVVKYAYFYLLTSETEILEPLTVMEALREIWTSTDMALFSVVIGYYFGARGMRYAMEKFVPSLPSMANKKDN